MKHALMLCPVLFVFATSAFAYAVNEVAGQTYLCGDVRLAFGPDGQTATLKVRKGDAGERVNVDWGNGAIDAVIGEYDFTVKATGRFELDGDACRLIK